MLEKRILVADDDRDIVRIIGMILKKAGYEVLLATDQKQAIALIQQFNPDLLLLDINMPAGIGMTIHGSAAAAAKSASIPVIYVTGDKSDGVAADSYENGGFGILYKPLDTSQLLANVCSVLERSKHRSEP